MQKYNIGSVPLLLPLVAFVGGLLLSQSGCPLWLTVSIGITGILVCWFVDRVVAIMVVVALVGVVDGTIQQKDSWTHAPGVAVTCSSVVHEIRDGEGARTMTLVIDSVHVDGGLKCATADMKVAATIPSFLPVLEEGDRISFTSKLVPLESHGDLPDEKDFTEYLRRNGVVAATMLHPDSVNVVGAESSFYWTLRRVKRQIERMIMRSSLSDDAGAFVVAVVLGDSSLLSSDMRDILTGAGLAHVLALSGLHVGVIAVFVTWLLCPLYLLRWRRVCCAAVILILWCYAMMTGLAPSVTRAVIMTSVFLLAIIFERKSTPLNSLCVAALLILAFDPSALVSLSFQMSFVAVAAILAALWLIDPLRERLDPWLFALLLYVAVPVAAMAGTGIISAYHFHTLPLYCVIANIGVALFLPIVIGGGILLVISEAVGHDPGHLCAMLNVCVEAIYKIAGFIGNLPGARITDIYFNVWLMVPYFCVAALLVLWLRYRRMVWMLSALILCVAVGLLHFVLRPVYPESELFVTRERFYTNIIIRHGTDVCMMTTAKKHSWNDILDKCNEKYVDYLERRGASALENITAMANGRIEFANKAIHVVNDGCPDSVSGNGQVDYLLVCRGFKGDIVELSQTFSPDTVLLSNDINYIRHARYERELNAADIPCRSLRTGAFYLSVMERSVN